MSRLHCYEFKILKFVNDVNDPFPDSWLRRPEKICLRYFKLSQTYFEISQR